MHKIGSKYRLWESAPGCRTKLHVIYLLRVLALDQNTTSSFVFFFVLFLSFPYSFHTRLVVICHAKESEQCSESNEAVKTWLNKFLHSFPLAHQQSSRKVSLKQEKEVLSHCALNQKACAVRDWHEARPAPSDCYLAAQTDLSALPAAVINLASDECWERRLLCVLMYDLLRERESGCE